MASGIGHSERSPNNCVPQGKIDIVLGTQTVIVAHVNWEYECVCRTANFTHTHVLHWYVTTFGVFLVLLQSSLQWNTWNIEVNDPKFLFECQHPTRIPWWPILSGVVAGGPYQPCPGSGPSFLTSTSCLVLPGCFLLAGNGPSFLTSLLCPVSKKGWALLPACPSASWDRDPLADRITDSCEDFICPRSMYVIGKCGSQTGKAGTSFSFPFICF